MNRSTLSTLTVLLVGTHALGAPNGAPAPGHREMAQPFIEQNCLGCHGAKKAMAGFRVDLLGTDFAAPKVAEQWKEVIDRINAGEMPPVGRPRPDARQASAFVAW